MAQGESVEEIVARIEREAHGYHVDVGTLEVVGEWLQDTRLVVACVVVVAAVVWQAWAFWLPLLCNKGKLKPDNGDDKGKGSADSESVARLIAARRSVFPKDFTGDVVPEHVLQAMLEAARWAPTHGKTEPWRFGIVPQEHIGELLDHKHEFMEQHLKDNAEKWADMSQRFARKRKDVLKCSHLIIIAMHHGPNSSGKLMPEWEEVAAVACAVQNMHLQLTAFPGFGGYWSSGGHDSWLQSDRMKKAAGLQGNNGKVLGLFHLGVCGDAASRYRVSRVPIEQKTHRW